MKVKALMRVLRRLDLDCEVFVECPETEGSWSTNGAVVIFGDEQSLIIRIDSCDGPTTPPSDDQSI